MLGSAGRSEFFAREAADYLRALETLLGGPPPEGESFVRLARALRGAAMLAGPASYTRAASQLEQAAKQLRGGGLDWASLAPRLQQAHREFRRLAGLVAAWGPDLDQAAAALADSLKAMVDETAGRPPTAPAAGGEEGIRAYVARETATVADALRNAARVLASTDVPHNPALARVTLAMQSLRGLAGLAELAPLAELLDATDTAVRDLQRYPALPPGATELCAVAAEAFGRIAGEVAGRGRTDAELPEAHRFADRLHHALVGSDVVRSIDELDGGAPVLRRAEPRMAEPLDLASLGERLCAGADQLRHAPSRAAARLQALVLLAILRDAPGGLGRRPAGRLVARLVEGLADAATATTTAPGDLAAPLEAAGRLLADRARDDLEELESALDAISLTPEPAAAAAVDGPVVDIASLAPAPERPAIDTPADRSLLERSLSRYSRLVRENAPVPPLPRPAARAEVVPIGALAPAAEPAADAVHAERVSPPDDDAAVPIEDLAPDEAELEPVVPIAALAPDGAIAAAEPPGTDTLPAVVPIESLAPSSEPDVVSIEALAPDAEPEVGPIGELAPDDEEEVVPIEALAPAAAWEPDVVPIEVLLYSGQGALDRADEIRRLLERSLRTASRELDRVEPLVQELLDLVPLALAGVG